ncbi:TonB-dependent siderophore receptor [Orrella dioscoreae]|uniref:TonB-dependent siderophore receptor n=1 Tax=Orrella dioscoreae TaxID=1851544 RepID=A0A1C3K5U2_9BURK|nr:TonB-dependent siderophore receptor [Orrella dioscoreae]SBT26824.1 TonB-dependent siderophore receptor [Orrella dioscoreae]SOE52423.1 TonB-dependent siderophore receptor [Orrella dioscoreae]
MHDRMWAAVALGAALASPQALAQAALPDGGAPRSYAVAAGPLGPVLNQIVTGTGLALSVPPALVEGRMSAGVAATLAPVDALRTALRGTGLVLVATPSGALSVQPAPVPAAGGVTHLAPVSVEAPRLDATSEGTQSYTVRAVSVGKEVVSLREMPQSISVVTRTQMDDQNVVSLGDAMRYVTGIRVLSTSTGVVNLRSRGFRLNNYLIDGMPLRGGQGMWGSALMDMALYDRVEVWRGPAGLLEGAGEPSGTINLARKRAQADAAMRATAMAGSWDRYRAELDTTGSLNEQGTLRGRFVAVYDKRRSFVDTINQESRTVYGTLSYDVDASTTLSAGMTVQRGDSVAFAGLPLMAGGGSPDVSRSTFLGSRHGVKEDRAHSAFLDLERRLENGGTWRTQLNQTVTRNDMARYISNSMIDPVTRLVTIEGARQKSVQINRAVDSYLSLPFQAWGQSHTVTVGANYQVFKGGQIQQRFATWRVPVDAPPQDLRMPEGAIGDPPEPKTIEYGAYANLRLRPVSGVTFLAGARMAWWDNKDPDAPENRQRIDGRFVPNLGLIVDLDDRFSVYASYNRIFSPQTERFVAGGFLSPRTGEQVELGVKGEFLDGQLTGHVAVFRIDDKGRAVDDPQNEDYSLAAGHVRSQGVEAELSGRLTPRWDMTAGYAYTSTRHRDGLPDMLGQPFDSTFPRHQFSLWTRYRLGQEAGRGVFVGGGVRTSSATYAEYSGERYQQGGFSVVSLQAGYAWGPDVSAALTVNNVFDKRYFERYAGGSNRQTYFGEPANVMLTLRGKF